MIVLDEIETKIMNVLKEKKVDFGITTQDVHYLIISKYQPPYPSYTTIDRRLKNLKELGLILHREIKRKNRSRDLWMLNK